MSLSIKQRLAAILAFVVSLMAVFSGSLVLLGLSQPAYHVIPLLVIYNVTLGVVGLADGWGLWTGRDWAEKLVYYILGFHLVVLILLLVLRLFDVEVAIHSIGAMTFRVLIWSIVGLLLRKRISAQGTPR